MGLSGDSMRLPILGYGFIPVKSTILTKGDTMIWKVKTFKTKEKMLEFLSKGSYQHERIFINNVPYAIEYRNLRKE